MDDETGQLQPSRKEVAFELIKLLARNQKESAYVDDDYPLAYRIVATLIYVLIFLMGVVGNLAFIIVIARKKVLRSRAIYYMVK